MASEPIAQTFEELCLDPRLLKALASMKHVKPTPIQAAAIPVAIEGHDVLGCAQTGTGKTASFVLPTLHRLAQAAETQAKKAPRALILAPTRELAVQIHETVRALSQHLRLHSTLLIGGVGMNPQEMSLRRGTDIIVATPGRLMDHMQRRAVRLDQVEVVILDEADRMLDMGFIRPVRQILGQSHPERQTLLFSATLTREIERLADELLYRPERIEVASRSSTPTRVHQELYWVDGSQKKDALLFLLQNPAMTQTIVFTRTKHGADRLAKQLDQSGHKTVVLHGNKSQSQRRQALDRFKRGDSAILVATDIAARGIDVIGVSHVVNFDAPQAPEDYVHRIGRTGRADATGIALSLVSNSERSMVRSIERLTQKPIVVGHIEGLPAPSRAPRQAAGGGGGGYEPPPRPPRSRRFGGGGRHYAA